MSGGLTATVLSAGSNGGQRIYSYIAGTVRHGLGVDLTGQSYMSNWFGSAGPSNQGVLSLGFVSHSDGTTFNEVLQIKAYGEVWARNRFRHSGPKVGEVLSRGAGTTWVTFARLPKANGFTKVQHFLLKCFSSENGGLHPFTISGFFHNRSTASPYGDFGGIIVETPTTTVHQASSWMEFRYYTDTDGAILLQTRNTTYGVSFNVVDFWHNYGDDYWQWIAS